jgi:hypothetical protein
MGGEGESLPAVHVQAGSGLTRTRQKKLKQGGAEFVGFVLAQSTINKITKIWCVLWHKSQ